jgi:SPP1 family predicted phage head-tail adaptor
LPNPASIRTQQWIGINPGELRHRVQLQLGTSTQDAVGQKKKSWTTVWTCWAGIRSLTQREIAQQHQVTAQSTHEIKMRYTNQVSVMAGMRFLFGSQVYMIQGVSNPDQRNLVLLNQVQQLNGVE